MTLSKTAIQKSQKEKREVLKERTRQRSERARIQEAKDRLLREQQEAEKQSLLKARQEASLKKRLEELEKRKQERKEKVLESRRKRQEAKRPPPPPLSRLKGEFSYTLLPSDGTKCAVVGNAANILEKRDGALIDSYPLVVRINTPYTESMVSQGSKCDVLFVTPLSFKVLYPDLKKFIEPVPYQIINVSTTIITYFNMWSDRLRESVNDEKARPTTGFIAIAKMIELGYDVDIFGFDWFSTPSLNAYLFKKKINLKAEDTLWKHHYPEWERDMVAQLLQNK